MASLSFKLYAREFVSLMGSARYLLVAIRRAECACASTCLEKALAESTALLRGSKVFHVSRVRVSLCF